MPRIVLEGEMEGEVEIWCDVCHTGLCGVTRVTRGTNLYVMPCKSCLADERQTGFEAGEAEGFEAGKRSVE